MSLAGSSAPQSIPRLAEPVDAEPTTGDSTPRTAQDIEEKKKKRSLFGFGKKKAEEPAKVPPARSAPKETVAARRSANASPILTEHQHFMPTSPGRLASSPRLASPAGSQIFERDVQESTALPNSPAIPSHIQTENYIPPVLDASSEAITDSHLDPDNVEIITHASHQPASAAVTGSGLLEPSWADELAAFASEKGTDSASNYGSFDTTDVRRLSFISFADVVQSEQGHGGGLAGGSRDSMHLAGLTSLASMGMTNRSPSPIRSPVSSAGGPETSPPTSKSGSVKGLEMSPSRKPLGSPTALQHPTVSGELAIETMSQALRRTGSGDLSVLRSLPSSPI
ncbi:hypothetical protein QBC47DRAFT_8320 [Echria macrotheca]|uniref:Uncharacterized protein n=1 Tax=Echria macrotheca TaxID=438768 RepID=A0AAJ0BM66_9PEZI|nr:hypothetical protein QBC47DRAFT_8320 [Echria macrotheca]